MEIEPFANSEPRRSWIPSRIRACSCSSFDLPNMICAIVCGGLWLMSTYTTPTPLYIPPNDSLSSFPKRDVGLPYTYVTIGFCVGLAALVAVSYFLSSRYPTLLRQCRPFTTIWIGLTCFCLTGFITNIFKDFVGRARPDFYAYCGEGATYETCQDKAHRDEEFRSWPSGHSSGSMSGAIFLAFFAQKAVRLQAAWVSVAASIFICAAFYVGSTRIIGFRHHPDDVIAGLFLGYVVTSLVWQKTQEDLFEQDPAPTPE